MNDQNNGTKHVIEAAQSLHQVAPERCALNAEFARARRRYVLDARLQNRALIAGQETPATTFARLERRSPQSPEGSHTQKA